MQSEWDLWEHPAASIGAEQVSQAIRTCPPRKTTRASHVPTEVWQLLAEKSWHDGRARMGRQSSLGDCRPMQNGESTDMGEGGRQERTCSDRACSRERAKPTIRSRHACITREIEATDGPCLEESQSVGRHIEESRRAGKGAHGRTGAMGTPPRCTEGNKGGRQKRLVEGSRFEFVGQRSQFDGIQIPAAEHNFRVEQLVV